MLCIYVLFGLLMFTRTHAHTNASASHTNACTHTHILNLSIVRQYTCIAQIALVERRTSSPKVLGLSPCCFWFDFLFFSILQSIPWPWYDGQYCYFLFKLLLLPPPRDWSRGYDNYCKQREENKTLWCSTFMSQWTLYWTSASKLRRLIVPVLFYFSLLGHRPRTFVTVFRRAPVPRDQPTVWNNAVKTSWTSVVPLSFFTWQSVSTYGNEVFLYSLCLSVCLLAQSASRPPVCLSDCRWNNVVKASDGPGWIWTYVRR